MSLKTENCQWESSTLFKETFAIKLGKLKEQFTRL